MSFVCFQAIDMAPTVQKALNKQKIIDTVVDGQLLNAARSKSYFKEFVKRLSSKYGEDFVA